MMDTRELAKLVEVLPQAKTLDLYCLEYAIRALLGEPRRILDIRSRIRLGTMVRFFNAIDGTYRTGRIEVMRDLDLTLLDLQHKMRFTHVPYAALDLESQPGQHSDIQEEPQDDRSKPKTRSRADFRTGDTVSFLDRQLQPVVGKIVRLNPKTASIEATLGAGSSDERFLTNAMI